MKLKILGHEYDVQFNDKLDFNDRTVAQINTNALWIQISTIHPKTRQEEGLIHEIFEAINYHLELKLKHPAVTTLSENLYQVLKDNNLLNLREVIKMPHRGKGKYTSKPGHKKPVKKSTKKK